MTTLESTDNLQALRLFLYDHLVNSVIPFWLDHAVDEAGGINTCIQDDGRIINRDKWLLRQWRAVWTFSKLYNRIAREKRWLDLAEHIYQFAARFGWDKDVGAWRLRLSHDGKTLDGCKSIYVDAFAVYGLTEFAQATGSNEPIELARMTAEQVLRRLDTPHDRLPLFPYSVPPGSKMHGVPMIFSLVFWELGQFVDGQHYRDAALAMSNEVFGHFYRPNRDLILERIAQDNNEISGPLGTTVVPGHVIEDMWFQIHIARDCGHTQRIAEAVRLIRRHMELAWDQEYGGMFLAVDADGAKDIGWDCAQAKIWWPHTEALYALLLAYEHSHEPCYLDWYRKVHDYSFSHYPVPRYGEWRQNLDRFGRAFQRAGRALEKDPFHLPRSLIYCLEVLDRLIENSASQEASA